MKVAFITLIVALTGCVSGGTYFEWDHAKQVKVGMDKEEVIRTIGSPPTIKATNADGLEVWKWTHVSTSLVAMKTRTFFISFREDKVVTVPYIAKDME